MTIKKSPCIGHFKTPPLLKETLSKCSKKYIRYFKGGTVNFNFSIYISSYSTSSYLTTHWGGPTAKKALRAKCLRITSKRKILIGVDMAIINDSLYYILLFKGKHALALGRQPSLREAPHIRNRYVAMIWCMWHLDLIFYLRLHHPLKFGPNTYFFFYS